MGRARAEQEQRGEKGVATVAIFSWQMQRKRSGKLQELRVYLGVLTVLKGGREGIMSHVLVKRPTGFHNRNCEPNRQLNGSSKSDSITSTEHNPFAPSGSVSTIATSTTNSISEIDPALHQENLITS